MRGSDGSGRAGWGARARARGAEAVAVAAAVVLVGGVVAVAEDRADERADDSATDPGTGGADRLSPGPSVSEEALPGFSLEPALPDASATASATASASTSAVPSPAATGQAQGEGLLDGDPGAGAGEGGAGDGEGGTRVVVLAVDGPSTARVGESVTFRVSVRTTAGTPVLTGARFGDGAEGGTAAPCAGLAGPAFRGVLTVTHTYTEPGTYEPYFVATVPCGPSSGAGTSLRVGGAPAPPGPLPAPTPTAGPAPSPTTPPSPTTSPSASLP